eukprot:102238_1
MNSVICKPNWITYVTGRRYINSLSDCGLRKKMIISIITNRQLKPEMHNSEIGIASFTSIQFASLIKSNDQIAPTIQHMIQSVHRKQVSGMKQWIHVKGIDTMLR